jgi:hypothetical protein
MAKRVAWLVMNFSERHFDTLQMWVQPLPDRQRQGGQQEILLRFVRIRQ